MCILHNLTLFYSVSLIYFFWAATAFDMIGTDNAEELLTCGFQYSSLPISILHFVARIFGRKLDNFALLNAGENGKHQNLQATGKKSSSRLSGGCAIVITTGKKRYSCLSGGCRIIITTGKKKVLVVCLAGARSLLRPKKKKF